MLGPEGVLASARPGTLLVDMSTIAPALARQLAEAAASRRVAFLDAPVSGGEVGAEAGSLVIMVGGEEEVLERARPVLAAVGSQVVHVGPHGAGQIVKACNQVVVALTYAAVSEALVLGSKSGIAPELSSTSSPAGSPRTGSWRSSARASSSTTSSRAVRWT